VACLAAAISISGALIAEEPPAITFRNNAQYLPKPISGPNVTFPSTSSAPIRWKTPLGTAHLTSHIDDVQHTSSFGGQSGIMSDDASFEQDTAIQSVAFTLQLDGPKNGQSSPVQTAAGTSRRPAAKSGQADSVLSSRRAGARPGSLVKSPLSGRSQPAEEEGASPRLFSVAPGEASEVADQPGDEASGRLQLSQDPPGPPLPVDDPEDVAPTPPTTLQPRATPQFTQQPLERTPLRDPAKVVQPPVPGGKKKRCNNPNDRDCCADEENCAAQLARLTTSDKLSRYNKRHLDITPRYMPGETPEEHEENEKNKRVKLKQAGKREWQDKQGRPVASGSLADIALGKAIIETDSGDNVEVSLRELSDDDLCFIAAWYSLPTECTLGNELFQGRQFVASTMTWKASALCHKPLYFEDVQLERYGHTLGPVVQPFASGAHFFANVALLPYKMGINPPRECQYPLGYYRPGSCAPWMLQPFPLSARGAATAAGFYTGANFLIP